jgi:hypothetical protein
MRPCRSSSWKRAWTEKHSSCTSLWPHAWCSCWLVVSSSSSPWARNADTFRASPRSRLAPTTIPMTSTTTGSPRMPSRASAVRMRHHQSHNPDAKNHYYFFSPATLAQAEPEAKKGEAQRRLKSSSQVVPTTQRDQQTTKTSAESPHP